MTIIDGKALSSEILDEIKISVDKLKEEGRRIPGLAVLMIGDNAASESYVSNKIKSCKRVGFLSQHIHLDDNASQQEIMDIISDLNQDDAIDGFIVQLPLPDHLNVDSIISAIDPAKDVDGFHPENIGNLALGRAGFISATPNGIMEMLSRYKIETQGKHVVVIGRSNIVGRPMSILLSRNGNPGNATVTLAHSRTTNIKELCLQADIIIAAVGRPNMVTADMVKQGTVVIDVGINRVDDESKKRGYRLVGDVDFESVSEKASFISPVPGGVGPMTVTSLLMNTLKSYNNKSE